MRVSQAERLFNEAVPGSDLMVRLETPLPSQWTGRGSALFCSGACFHRREEVTGLELVLGEARHRPSAWGMPRLELFQLLHPGLDPGGTDRPNRDPNSEGDPELRAYRSGFWATIPVSARERGASLGLKLAVRLAGGGHVVAPLGEIEVRDPPEPPACASADGDGPLIAICMATFDPERALFEAQVESIKAQDHQRWICLISDDHSTPDRFEAVTDAVAGDPRFVVWRSPRTLGAYRNFERALGMAPRDAELIALCDQDDRWYPDKLSTLRDRLGTAQLAYSDQRLVDEKGSVLSPTLWRGRRNNHTDMASLLVANSVTGSATLLRREVAELALPFPDPPGWQFHDHWIALVALSSGSLAYVDRPLYDYVQHGAAVIGNRAGRPRPSRGPAQWRASYFYGYLAREVQARALLERVPGLTATKRRALRRFGAADRRPGALAWLAARPLRPRKGFAETLGTEWELARGVLWRRIVGLRAGRRITPFGRPLEAACPPIEAATLGQTRLARWRAGVAASSPPTVPSGEYSVRGR